jgi:DNA-directed RNA polymerase specialized sigma24 family protein
MPIRASCKTHARPRLSSAPTREVMRRLAVACLQDAMEDLPERHRYVLLHRYGLDTE